METRAKEENILKYFNALKKLKTVLDYTSKVSMMEFSEKNNLTKNLSNVLQKGGIIVNIGKRGKGAEWKWNTIEPSREMAIKTLQQLSNFNPPRKSKRGGKREGSGRKTKTEELETLKIKLYEIPFFFGLFKINVKPIYN